MREPLQRAQNKVLFLICFHEFQLAGTFMRSLVVEEGLILTTTHSQTAGQRQMARLHHIRSTGDDRQRA
jgi:hypothetical protein